MRQLEVRNADVAAPILRIPEGNYKMLYLVVEGTNTATAVALSDLGKMLLSKNGRPIVSNVDLTLMMHFANVHGGRIPFSSTISSNLYFIVPIFCFDPENPGNILSVKDEDICHLQVSWGASFTSRLASGDVKICGDDAQGIQAYEYLYRQHDYDRASATTIKEIIPGENFARIGMNNMDDSDVVRIQIIVDGQVLHDCTRIEGLYSSLFRSRIEDIGATEQIGTGEVTADVYAEFPIVVNNEFSEMLSDDLNVTIITNGAFTAQILTTHLDFTPTDLGYTQGRLVSTLNNKMSRKRSLGKGRPLTVADKIQAASFSKAGM